MEKLKKELTKELFKEIYGIMIGTKYEKLTPEEIANIIEKTLQQFRENFNVWNDDDEKWMDKLYYELHENELEELNQ